ncbi:hypothetical protein BOX15_Mlig028464g2 [Macrostomum lignano]|uniref:Uncharacterized protein n=1 Tax=Macrostomum lignano TaxID=282301 RepID=A0A267FQ39_9PLAT|nr:hypothetical protein BOX15_Mlig028464g2 [Macrostomum lignano]
MSSCCRCVGHQRCVRCVLMRKYIEWQSKALSRGMRTQCCYLHHEQDILADDGCCKRNCSVCNNNRSKYFHSGNQRNEYPNCCCYHFFPSKYRVND